MHTQQRAGRAHTVIECTRRVPHGQHAWRETTGKRRRLVCPGAQGQPPSATIRLRPEAFTADALQSYGWDSPTAAANAIGIHSSTLRRAIAGQIAPGERLIAALLIGTARDFDALFHVVADTRIETPLPTDDEPPAGSADAIAQRMIAEQYDVDSV